MGFEPGHVAAAGSAMEFDVRTACRVLGRCGSFLMGESLDGGVTSGPWSIGLVLRQVPDAGTRFLSLGP